MELTDAVDEAVRWADDSGDGVAAALASLARKLAGEIADPTMAIDQKSAPPLAQMAKELRATLEGLEALRDGDDAEASLGVVLSTPVWNAPESGASEPGSSRRKGGRKSG